MKPESRPSPSLPVRARWCLLGALASLAAFYLVGIIFLDGFALDLGSTGFPAVRYLAFVSFYAFLGGLVAILLALGIARRWGLRERTDAFLAHWNAGTDRRFLVWTSVAAFAIPLLFRFGLLRGAPVADDESAYRFTAQLLASGRLWVPSHELKLFFDQNFIINDGRMFSVYFLGWPALLAAGVRLGATWIVNPLCSALTVAPLFFSLRRFVDVAWARAGVVLFLSAPFLQFGAATELAHTSCLAALTWCLWMFLRSQSDDGLPRHHFFFALAFAVAFFIRPQSALPIGLPLLLAWAFSLRRLEVRARWRAILAFGIPAASLAALFMASLWAQNGSPFRVGYVRYAQYLWDNDFRFATFRPQDLSALPGFDFTEFGPAIARTAVGMFRLNFDLFGWPSSLVFVLAATPFLGRRARLLWAMVASYVLLHLFQVDWGIDSFGPVHAFELALPLIVLSIIGAESWSSRLGAGETELGDSGRWRWSAFPAALLAAFIATAWLGFVPVRAAALGQVSTHLKTALDAPVRAGLEKAVVFSPWPFAPPCGGTPNHYVNFRPVNDPDLATNVLWVNHLDVETDRRLMATLPGRSGYVLRWTERCEVVLLPLDSLTAADVPPGVVRRPRD